MGHADGPPSKRPRRGKYASKACDQCQQRKVKCDGAFPCQPCMSTDRQCHMDTVDLRRRMPSTNAEQQQESGHGVDPKHLAAQLNRIENQLELVLSSISGDKPRASVAGAHVPDKTDMLPSFSGETSIRHTLGQIESFFEHKATPPGQVQAIRPRSGQDSTPSPDPLPDHSGDNRLMSTDVRRILKSHDISPCKSLWDGYLQTFCEEVHILYPFLHIPTLRNSYNDMWTTGMCSSTGDMRRSRDYEIRVAQVWICIALGRCTESVRTPSKDSHHAAGWSLYTAATDLIGDLFDIFRCSQPILALQVLALMVVYLFRIDANERAEKLLALTISHAHHLGFHRCRAIEQLPVFHNEMILRLWWCLYAMDRRLAIESGHPFLIQDVNVDTPYPRDLTDEWLASFRDDKRSPSELVGDINAEIAKDSITPIPYLAATIRYSQIVGKVWEAMYGAKAGNVSPSLSMLEYLEQLLSRAQNGGSEAATECMSVSSPWWRVKQQMLMRVRWLSLRLLIRKPILQQKPSSSEFGQEDLENDLICMRTASSIFQEFSRIPEKHTRSAYPFLHYVLGAVMISLGLMIKDISFKPQYGKTLLEMVESLDRYCHQTWMSGKITRTVWKLKRMATVVLGDCKPVSSNGLFSRNSGLNCLPRDISFIHGHSHEGSVPACTASSQGQMLNNSVELSNPEHFHSTNHINAPAGPSSLALSDFEFEESTPNNTGRLLFTPNEAEHAHYGLTMEQTTNQANPNENYGLQMQWLNALFDTDLSSYLNFQPEDRPC